MPVNYAFKYAIFKKITQLGQKLLYKYITVKIIFYEK